MYRLYVKLKTYHRKRKKIRNLNRQGSNTILKLQNILERSGLFFFFDMGTLLGIVREGRILKHDLDIDVAVYASSEDEKEFLRNLLMENSCRRRLSFSIDGLGIVEESFIYKNIKFDINYYYRENNDDVCYLMYSSPKNDSPSEYMNVVRLGCKPILTTCKKKFGNSSIFIPVDAESYLAERYGSNWRVPDKQYIYWKGPSTTQTDYLALRTVYE